MFGLALRSYQLKLQRLQESASDDGVTLWSAVRSFVEERGSVTRSEVTHRFRHDDEASVRGILNDLVESGLVYRAGRGDASLFRVTPQADLERLALSEAEDASASLVWLAVCQNGPLSRAAIAQASTLAPERLESALSELVADGRVCASGTSENGEELFSADRCLIPIGDEAGWEAALLDHHQAVLNAIAAKVSAGATSSNARDETGGTTYRFELWPGHPAELEVRGLLGALRAHTGAVWDRVSGKNAEIERPEAGRYSVTVYVGQHVCQENQEA
jgi:hypothetical protein